MKIFYNTSFKGHWPVGVAALIVAESVEDAVSQLKATLILEGRGQEAVLNTVREKDMVQISPVHENVFILNDGNY